MSISLTDSQGNATPALSGYLKIFLGCMFSGKTTEVVNVLTREADTGYKTLFINNSADIRPDAEGGDLDNFTSHSSTLKSMSGKITKAKVTLLGELEESYVNQFDIIGIDEANQYSDLVEVVKYWVNVLGKHVYIAGLDGSFSKKKFGHILDLIPEADDVIKVKAQCILCLNEYRERGYKRPILGLPASFSMKTGGTSSELEIGGKDKYIPVCRAHWRLYETPKEESS